MHMHLSVFLLVMNNAGGIVEQIYMSFCVTIKSGMHVLLPVFSISHEQCRSSAICIVNVMYACVFLCCVDVDFIVCSHR